MASVTIPLSGRWNANNAAKRRLSALNRPLTPRAIPTPTLPTGQTTGQTLGEWVWRVFTICPWCEATSTHRETCRWDNE